MTSRSRTAKLTPSVTQVSEKPPHTSLSRHTFTEPVRRFFDSASVGIVAQEAESSAADAEKRVPWSHAVEEVKAGLSRLLSVRTTYLTLYHNTTAGVQRVFTRLGHLTGRGEPTLLTSDIEYPGIMALADENWGGRLIVVQVADLVWGGKCHLVEPVLKKAILLACPTVFYGSHVARASGFVLSTKLLRFAREVNPNIVTIIDGAQAVGNIVIEPEMLQLADFYVTSGHKWLGGKQTLGIVHAHDCWKLDDPAQGYSAASGSRGTGSLASLASLARAVEDINGATSGGDAVTRVQRVAKHNASLARYFSQQLRRNGFRTVGGGQRVSRSWKWSGIVVLLDLPGSISQKLRTMDGIEFSHLTDEPWRQAALGGAPRGPRYTLGIKLGGGQELEAGFERVELEELASPVPFGGCARFCFHYYHRKGDVDRLVKAVNESS